MTKLHIEDAASTFLYFGYTLIMVFLFFLLTGKLGTRLEKGTQLQLDLIFFLGTIGFFACFWFVRKIYSVVKVD